MRVSPSFALLVLGGCVDLSFEGDSTTIRAAAKGDGTTVVRICAPPTGFLSCNGDEAFHVTVGGVTAEATPRLFSFGALVAVFEVDAPGGTVVTVTRDRDGAVATVTLPPALELVGSVPAAVSRHAGVTLRWQPGGDTVTWTASASCQSEGSSAIFGDDEPDDGEIFIHDDGLPEVSAPCAATITLSREQEGTVGDAFSAGSRIVGAQEQTVPFTLSP